MPEKAMRQLHRESPLVELADNDCAKRAIFMDSLQPCCFTVDFYDQAAIPLFDRAKSKFLPPLPWGYHWEKHRGKYGIYRLLDAPEHRFNLVLYGPNENQKINYNLLVDNYNSFSLAHTRTRNQARLHAKDRNYPSPIKANASGYKTETGTPYMPGHCIDHIDSILPSNTVIQTYGMSCNSSYNHKNYIPEVQKDYWGLYMRKGLVAAQRRQQEPYAQFVEYSENPVLTRSSAAIPESLYFFRLSGSYEPQQICWIDWSENYNNFQKPRGISMTAHMNRFSTSTEAAPRALLWNVNSSNTKWRAFTENKRHLGHNIRKGNNVQSHNPLRDQFYAYSDAASLEYENLYANISMALAASDLKKPALTLAVLRKSVRHGTRLLELDDHASIIDRDRLKWVKKYNRGERPGFADDAIVDAIRQIALH